MNIQLPEDLARTVDDEVRKGHFASKDDLVAAAVREFLRLRVAKAADLMRRVADRSWNSTACPDFSHAPLS